MNWVASYCDYSAAASFCCTGEIESVNLCMVSFSISSFRKVEISRFVADSGTASAKPSSLALSCT